MVLYGDEGAEADEPEEGQAHWPITVHQFLQAVPRQRQQVDLRAQTQSWVK